MSVAVKKKNRMYYIHSLICIAFMFLFGFLPPFADEITSTGMQGIGILLGLCWGWSFVEMIWPSILSFIAMVWWNLDTLENANMFGFGNNIVMVVVFMCIFAYYLDKTGLIQWIAEWFISRKIAVGRPWVMVWLIGTSACVITGILTNPYPAILLSWGVVFSICDHTGIKRKTDQSAVLLGAVILGAAFGCLFFPWAITAYTYNSLLVAAVGTSIGYVNMMVCYMTFGILSVAIYSLICKFVLRVDMSKLTEDESVYAKYRNQKMNKDQRTGFSVLLLFMFLLTFSSVVPESVPILGAIASKLNAYSVVGLGMIIVVVLSIIRNRETGEAVYDIADFCRNGIKWELYFMLAATMPIANVIESDEAGLMDWFVATFMPFLSSLNPFMCLTVAIVLFMLITQLVHNFVLGVVFIPLLAPLLAELGVNPIVFGMAMSLGLSNAFITPASSGNSSLMYANHEWITSKLAYKYMTVSFIGTAILLVGVYIPISYLLLN